MKNCMVKLTELFFSNQLTLNLTNKKLVTEQSTDLRNTKMYDKITINGNVIHWKNQVKYIGLMIDELLS